MDRLDGSAPVPEHLRGGIVALGNFDGFHRGHQEVVGRAVARGRAEGRPVLVATFDPHPVRYFEPDARPFRLTTLGQRERLFQAAGADAMLIFSFDHALAYVTAQDFVTQWLIDRIGASAVVAGEDFTFGHRRRGNMQVMAELAADKPLVVEGIAPVSDAGGPISSSRIRDALRRGDPREAARLLTRPFAIEGLVEHGAKLGRTIGYPTANVTLGDYLRPAYGIYAVRAKLHDGRVVEGAANIGIRPSIDPPVELLETFIFDFVGSLYGEMMEVNVIDYIRPEARFETLEALTTQMDADCVQIRTLLADEPA